MADHQDSPGKVAPPVARDRQEEAKERAKSAVHRTKGEAKARAEDVGEALQHSAGRLADQIREGARTLLNEQKDRVAEVVHGFAETLRDTARKLEREDKVAGGRYAEQVADQIDRLSVTLRQRHWNDIVSNTEDFARRQPQLFMAGAVTAGFVLARLLASSSPPNKFLRHSAHAGSGGKHEPIAGYGAGSDI